MLVFLKCKKAADFAWSCHLIVDELDSNLNQLLDLRFFCDPKSHVPCLDFNGFDKVKIKVVFDFEAL